MNMSLRWIAAAVMCAGCASSPAPTQSPAPTTAPTTATVVVPAPPPAPAPADPVGNYEFTTQTPDGQSIAGTLSIAGTPGAYTGKIVTSMFPEIPITAVNVDGQTINVKGAMPDGELAIHFTMDGATFKGGWVLGGDSGDFSGKKLPKQ